MPGSSFQSQKNWYQSLKRTLVALFSNQGSDSEPDNDLLQLPDSVRYQLSTALKKLPNHPSYVDQLKTDFPTAFEAWDESDCTHNVWIIVGASVDNLSNVIGDFLAAIADSSAEKTYRGLPLRFIQWSDRPDIESLQQQLKPQLGSNENREIVAIPWLEHYFLRSVNGLERLDSLKQQLMSDPSRFWIIGLGAIGWKYLKAIYALEACSYQITELKELSGDQLQDWMHPAFAELDIDFQSSLLKSKLPNKESDWQKKYFEDLADESAGVDTVAVQLFVNSLKSLDDGSDTEGKDTSNALKRYKIRAKSPKRPSLPDLEGEENIYILHSLLIHRALTKAELAETLGLTVHQIEHQIQTLRMAGVVQQQSNSLHIAPIYYPAVCKKLVGDNFIQ